jgi:site-specific DNA-methyltransferase (adenine-specific)
MQLIHGDCLEKMKSLKDNSIDLCLTDPPYGTTACKWDTVIPFEPMWEQLHRVVKDNGAICLFGSEPFSSALRMSNIKRFKYDWYWRKPKGTGHLNAKKMPLKDTELISVFQKKISYYPVFSIGTPYKNKAGKDHSRKTSMTDSYGKYTNFRNDNDGKRYPKTGIDFQVVERGSLHPTQKPVALLEYLIKTYTLENETVLDFTMGSGSTGVACKNLKRNFIGIEKDEQYFEIAKKRISDA